MARCRQPEYGSCNGPWHLELHVSIHLLCCGPTFEQSDRQDVSRIPRAFNVPQRAAGFRYEIWRVVTGFDMLVCNIDGRGVPRHRRRVWIVGCDLGCRVASYQDGVAVQIRAHLSKMGVRHGGRAGKAQHGTIGCADSNPIAPETEFIQQRFNAFEPGDCDDGQKRTCLLHWRRNDRGLWEG